MIKAILMAIKKPPKNKKTLPGGRLAGFQKKAHPEIQSGQALDTPTPDTVLR
jgi:hypothetical protein